MKEIKTCPFCGSPASVENDFGREFWVQCDEDHHSDGGMWATPDEAIAEWNRRA